MMKSRILIVAITFRVICSFVFAQDGWFWQNPLPTGNVYNDTYFIDENSGWIVGQWGVVIHVTDQGEDHSVDYIGDDNTLNGIFFTEENNGWIVGNSGMIYHSTDGGENWSGFDSGIENDLQKVFFPDADTGWIAGESGTILKTIDGGDNWNQQTTGIGELLYNVFLSMKIQAGQLVPGELSCIRQMAGNPGVRRIFSLSILSMMYISLMLMKDGFAEDLHSSFIQPMVDRTGPSRLSMIGWNWWQYLL